MNPPDDAVSRFADRGPATPPAWIAGTLEWRRRSWRERAWELMSDGRPIASMRVRGFLPMRWEVEGPSGPWRLRSRWTGRTEIFRGDDESPAATYVPGWFWGGAITTAGSERYAWHRAGFFSRTWVLENDSGFPVLRIVGRRGIARGGSRVEIDEAGRRLRGLEALVLLSWRLVLQARRRARHIAAAGAS